MFPQPDLKSRFDRDGFVIVREFLSPSELATLTAQVDRFIREVVPTLTESDAFFVDRDRPETLKQLQHMSVDPFFAEYLADPKWNELAETIIGEPCTAKGPEWFGKPPRTDHPTPPHQDNFYFCLRPPNVATLWLALDPVDVENGCLRYVAGSHRKGIRNHNPTKVLGFSQGIVDFGAEDEAAEVAVTLAPGDIVAHHGETIHRADPNTSATRHRRGFAMVFRGESVQRDEEANVRYQAALKSQHESLGLET
jgi:phytanoyl-CoA hydroxylase